MAEEKTAVKKQEKQDAPVRKTGFFKGVKAEFKKIIWPSKATVAKETGAVVFFGIALGVLIAIIDAVVAAGAKVYAFARYCPTSGEKENSISPQRYRKLLEDCDKIFRQYEAAGCETYFNRKDHLWTLYDYEMGRFQIPKDAEPDMIYGGCNCGNGHLTILPTGDVYACRRVQNSRVGNVFDKRLADLWTNEFEAYRDYDKFQKCSKCELKA